jgi:hypothetical protein
MALLRPAHSRGLRPGRAGTQTPALCVADASAPGHATASHTPAGPRRRRRCQHATGSRPTAPAYAPSPSSLWTPPAAPAAAGQRPPARWDDWLNPGPPAARRSPPDGPRVGSASDRVSPRHLVAWRSPQPRSPRLARRPARPGEAQLTDDVQRREDSHALHRCEVDARHGQERRLHSTARGWLRLERHGRAGAG